MDPVPDTPASSKAAAQGAEAAPSHVRQSTRTRMSLALAVAAGSDVLSFFFTLILPLQWALDITTALLLFLILGRRWAILPGLVAEAIPGMGIFPAWILVVFSVILYDDIRRIRN